MRNTVVRYYGKVRSYVQPYVRVDNKYDMILDYLYISDFPSACNRAALKEQGFTHVITIIPGVAEMFPEDFTYLTLDVFDRPEAPINQHFRRCIDFIEQARAEKGKVLVHCMCGISRSATIVCSYLIDARGYSSQSALCYIKDRRSCVCPNVGFMKQLDAFDADDASHK